MANNFESNFTRKVMEKVIAGFESSRVVSRNVNTQLFEGKFNPNTGDTIDVKRPTDYSSVRTSTGDITGQKKDIITGKASATVQDYITVAVDYNEADEALKMGDTSRYFDDAAKRIVTDLETDFAEFAMKNAGLLSGTVGTPVTSWNHIASAGALMQSSGVPMDGNWYYAFNPFTQASLANEQRSLGVNPEVKGANETAMVTKNFAGFKVFNSTTLGTYSIPSGADRVGALAANPIVTYVNAKDTMTQVLSISGLSANLQINAGTPLQITGRNRLNLSTRKPMVDASGNQVLFTGTVVEDATADGTGAVTVTVTGPAIFEAGGGYNTVDSAPISGDVVTLLGSPSTLVQPNLFWHRDAFTIASVPLKKLHSTDTLATTKDGLQLRTSLYSNGDANRQTVRIDLRPAYGVLNPFMAGQGHGV